jgi:hypothetical protein
MFEDAVTLRSGERLLGKSGQQVRVWMRRLSRVSGPTERCSP